MTLRQVADSLYEMTIAGYVNDTKYSRSGFCSALEEWMLFPESLKIKNRLVLQLSLPDGRWMATVNKFSDSADGYDYTIPADREEEAALLQLLCE